MSAMKKYKEAYVKGFSGLEVPQKDNDSPEHSLVQLAGYVDGRKARGEIIGGFTCT